MARSTNIESFENNHKDLRRQSWRITMAAVGGLLVAIILVGVAGFVVNRDIAQAANQALRYDVELEDNGDDLRVAVLDVRHYQRNMAFGGPSRAGIASFENAYDLMMSELDELE
ncbi:MAG: hypothetical protein ACRDSJ_17675, partial [Rubrobacteraceae bacterium]